MVEDPAEHDPGSGEEHPAKPHTAAWGFVLLVFAASRLFYLLAGALLAPIIPISPLQSQTSIFSLGTLSIWANFDGEHYVGVAESGYEEESPAFFPLYPLLVRSAVALSGGPVSPGALSFCGVLVSLVAFCFALYFVYRIAEEGWGARAARGGALLGLLPHQLLLQRGLHGEFVSGALSRSRMGRQGAQRPPTGLVPGGASGGYA